MGGSLLPRGGTPLRPAPPRGADVAKGLWGAEGELGMLTEALLEADSSSLLAGWAAFLRLRGLERVAFRRLLGGLVEESSYSSAREKRSLNLEGSRGGGGWGSGTVRAPASWSRCH